MEGPDSTTATIAWYHTSTRYIFGVNLQGTRETDNKYVQFVHASLGFPAPTTFMNAVRQRFTTGLNQYTRLTINAQTSNQKYAQFNDG